MKKVVSALLFVAVVLLSTGCTTFRADGLSFMPNDDSMENLGSFSKSATVHEFFGTPGGTNLFNISSTAMKDKASSIIWSEINKKGGNGAINISIRYSVNPLHVFGNFITGSIWAPAKLKITGDIIKKTSKDVAEIETKEAIELALKSLQ